ncbi:hypothetical protein A1OE_1481 [Candidatus Endolissoclinum faulkneri L2]|uniref:Uncharacterized protein n=1 Tax=Candidatus Endolissoclinum faulkneri L2 TaxID=1193729 RepID=K7YJ30_9PROT|nr:hypothetical protein A1OE_1481 [Candidatus Endolissoclinum faulkneri L2]
MLDTICSTIMFILRIFFHAYVKKCSYAITLGTKSVINFT